jgi:hypothetical protein
LAAPVSSRRVMCRERDPELQYPGGQRGDPNWLLAFAGFTACYEPSRGKGDFVSTRILVTSCIVSICALVVACGSDSKTSTADGGATGGSGGARATRDGGSTGGSLSAASGTSGGADAYTETPCAGGTESPAIAASFPSCATICGAPSHCLPTTLATGSSSAAGLLPDCPNDGTNQAGKCIPDAIVATLGKFVFKKCTFFLDGTVGRCVPHCIASKESSSAGLLMQDVCGSQEVCSPCNDPTSNNATTHACDDYCGGAQTDSGAAGSSSVQDASTRDSG